MSLNVAADPPFPWAEGLAYSQAIRVDNLVFTAGQGGFDESGEIVGGGVEAQIRQAFQNLAAALASQGASLASVAKLTVYLVDGEDYEIFKRVREDMFSAPYPASTAVVAEKPRPRVAASNMRQVARNSGSGRSTCSTHGHDCEP